MMLVRSPLYTAVFCFLIFAGIQAGNSQPVHLEGCEISWVAGVENDLVGYAVEATLQNGQVVSVAVEGRQTTMVDCAALLKEGDSAAVRVVAIDSSGNRSPGQLQIPVEIINSPPNDPAQICISGKVADGTEMQRCAPDDQQTELLFQWAPPTHNTDGSELTDLMGYRFYMGGAPGNYEISKPLGDVNSLRLEPGDYRYFAVTAYDGAINESEYSNEVNITPLVGPPPLIVKIEVEDYKNGGEGVGYSDTTPGNLGGEYRQDDVDIAATDDIGGGYLVSWTDASEWLAFDVDVPVTGRYRVEARVASGVKGVKAFHLVVDGKNGTGPINFLGSNGWHFWQDVMGPEIPLSAGLHEFRLNFDTGGLSINFLRLIELKSS